MDETTCYDYPIVSMHNSHPVTRRPVRRCDACPHSYKQALTMAMEEGISQFVSITGASSEEAK